MNRPTPRFARNESREFYNVLRKRVNAYFEENSISKQGGRGTVFKCVCMFLLYLVPFYLILAGVVVEPWWVMASWVWMGLGMAGIGLGIMHDANHGSLSKKGIWNRLLGNSMNALGGNSRLWKLQHNNLHHTYTNVDGLDEDLNGKAILRFSPHQAHRPIHRFQHIYAWFFYSLLTLSWVLQSDYFRLFRYRKIGLIQEGAAFTKELVSLIAWKVFYLSYTLVLPLLLTEIAPWLILVGWLVMHLVAGFVLSIIFQTAHVMPESDFPQPDAHNSLENSWAVHQIATTSNYAPRSRFFSWFVGGLNFQIEHHLFSNISHIHYRKLSAIVAGTAEEFGIPYRSHRTFWGALKSHALMLRQLGSGGTYLRT